ncbi:hypothetical protein FE391_39730 [Nonomuraea sp. KC401]|uniref:hypothetical protein n=1 Tax=unclassified Nonomuraea TaxID=2593643 RepID=UPI0010FEBCBA|nr:MULTISPECIES: hypothetical protein [unclassified Nonomuraea]NBE93310.1 hypothetical protein [Nonomuraea sp. K271]TLF56196.1 hypothetical protein FE391_39730 [Nonomuraea sp. KC401]
MSRKLRTASVLTAACLTASGVGALPASAAAAATGSCKTYPAGGPSAAPGQPPEKVYAHISATCKNVYGVKLEMTLYRNGKKVGSKQICQDGPDKFPSNMTCEVNLRVNRPKTSNWKIKGKITYIYNFVVRESRSISKSFRA